MSRIKAEKLNIENGDWVFVKSSEGQLKAQIQLMEGVNEDTVWTWNAIGNVEERGTYQITLQKAQKGFY